MNDWLIDTRPRRPVDSNEEIDRRLASCDRCEHATRTDDGELNRCSVTNMLILLSVTKPDFGCSKGRFDAAILTPPFCIHAVQTGKTCKKGLSREIDCEYSGSKCLKDCDVHCRFIIPSEMTLAELELRRRYDAATSPGGCCGG